MSITRNRDHMKIMMEKDYIKSNISTQDLTNFNETIDIVDSFISSVL
jgi:hypothetical protein